MGGGNVAVQRRGATSVHGIRKIRRRYEGRHLVYRIVAAIRRVCGPPESVDTDDLDHVELHAVRGQPRRGSSALAMMPNGPWVKKWGINDGMGAGTQSRWDAGVGLARLSAVKVASS